MDTILPDPDRARPHRDDTAWLRLRLTMELARAEALEARLDAALARLAEAEEAQR